MAETFLGIDAGGSRTRAVLASACGEVLGVGYGGSANFRTVSFRAAAQSIQAAVEEARAASGTDHVAAVCIGSAGLEEPGHEAQGRALLGDVLDADTVLFDTDAYIAWAGAFELTPGILVIAGTGSISLAVDAAGQRHRLGGWGAHFGDEGSAYSLARAATSEALKMLDGRKPETGLLDALLEFAGLPGVPEEKIARELTAWLYARSPTEIARFSSRLDGLARDGDGVVERIFREAGEALAELALTAAMRLERPACISVAGSVLSKNVWVKRAFLSGLGESRSHFVEPAFSPVFGAVLVALQTRGKLSEGVLSRLKAGAALLLGG